MPRIRRWAKSGTKKQHDLPGDPPLILLRSASHAHSPAAPATEMRVPKRAREGKDLGDRMEDEALYSPSSPAPISSPEKMQVTEEMVEEPMRDDGGNQSAHGEIGQLTRDVQVCRHCGAAHKSRRKLFEHVRYFCEKAEAARGVASHPGLKKDAEDIDEPEKQWKYVGSGVMMRTFVKATRRILIFITDTAATEINTGMIMVMMLNTGKIIDMCEPDNTPDAELFKQFENLKGLPGT